MQRGVEDMLALIGIAALAFLFYRITWHAWHDDPYQYDWDGYEDYEDKPW
jgi:hypothetical protein